MINAYTELVNYEGNDWVSFLDKVGLFDIFSPISSLTSDPDEFRGVVRYVVWTYSRESEKILIGKDWSKNKEKIFDDTQLDPFWKPQLVDLNNDKVLSVINSWVSFQYDDIYGEITMLKELRAELMKSCLSSIKRGVNGTEIDYDQKFKNSEYVSDLRKRIKELESDLMKNDVKFKKGVSEIKSAQKAKNKVGIEKFAI